MSAALVAALVGTSLPAYAMRAVNAGQQESPIHRALTARLEGRRVVSRMVGGLAVALGIWMAAETSAQPTTLQPGMAAQAPATRAPIMVDPAEWMAVERRLWQLEDVAISQDITLMARQETGVNPAGLDQLLGALRTYGDATFGAPGARAQALPFIIQAQVNLWRSVGRLPPSLSDPLFKHAGGSDYTPERFVRLMYYGLPNVLATYGYFADIRWVILNRPGDAEGTAVPLMHVRPVERAARGHSVTLWGRAVTLDRIVVGPPVVAMGPVTDLAYRAIFGRNVIYSQPQALGQIAKQLVRNAPAARQRPWQAETAPAAIVRRLTAGESPWVIARTTAEYWTLAWAYGRSVEDVQRIYQDLIEAHEGWHLWEAQRRESLPVTPALLSPQIVQFKALFDRSVSESERRAERSAIHEGQISLAILQILGPAAGNSDGPRYQTGYQAELDAWVTKLAQDPARYGFRITPSTDPRASLENQIRAQLGNLAAPYYGPLVRALVATPEGPAPMLPAVRVPVEWRKFLWPSVGIGAALVLGLGSYGLRVRRQRMTWSAFVEKFGGQLDSWLGRADGGVAFMRLALDEWHAARVAEKVLATRHAALSRLVERLRDDAVEMKPNALGLQRRIVASLRTLLETAAAPSTQTVLAAHLAALGDHYSPPAVPPKGGLEETARVAAVIRQHALVPGLSTAATNVEAVQAFLARLRQGDAPGVIAPLPPGLLSVERYHPGPFSRQEVEAGGIADAYFREDLEASVRKLMDAVAEQAGTTPEALGVDAMVEFWRALYWARGEQGQFLLASDDEMVIYRWVYREILRWLAPTLAAPTVDRAALAAALANPFARSNDAGNDAMRQAITRLVQDRPDEFTDDSVRLQADPQLVAPWLRLALAGNLVDYSRPSILKEIAQAGDLAQYVLDRTHTPFVNELGGERFIARFQQRLAQPNTVLAYLPDNNVELAGSVKFAEICLSANPTLTLLMIAKADNGAMNDGSVADVRRLLTVRDGVPDVYERLRAYEQAGRFRLIAGPASHGMPLDRLPPEAVAALQAADVVFGEGEANTQSLNGLAKAELYLGLRLKWPEGVRSMFGLEPDPARPPAFFHVDGTQGPYYRNPMNAPGVGPRQTIVDTVRAQQGGLEEIGRSGAGRRPPEFDVPLQHRPGSPVFEQFLDALLGTMNTGAQKRSVDLRPVVALAQQINPRFTTHIPPARQAAAAGDEVATLGRDLRRHVFFPADLSVSFMREFGPGSPLVLVRNPIRAWTPVPYLDTTVWEAELAEDGRTPRDAAWAVGRYAFRQTTASHLEARNTHTQMIAMARSEFPDRRLLGSWVLRCLDQCTVAHKNSVLTVIDRVEADSHRYEERRHAQDGAYIERRTDRAVRESREDDPVGEARILLKPGAPLRQSFDPDHLERYDWPPQDFARALVELAGNLGGTIALMDEYIRQEDFALAYLAAARYLALQFKVGDRWRGDYHAQAARFLHDELVRRFGRTPHPVLLKRLEGSSLGDRGAAEMARAVLWEIYRDNFWTDAERAQQLGLSGGLEETPAVSETTAVILVKPVDGVAPRLAEWLTNTVIRPAGGLEEAEGIAAQLQRQGITDIRVITPENFSAELDRVLQAAGLESSVRDRVLDDLRALAFQSQA